MKAKKTETTTNVRELTTTRIEETLRGQLLQEKKRSKYEQIKMILNALPSMVEQLEINGNSPEMIYRIYEQAKELKKLAKYCLYVK